MKEVLNLVQNLIDIHDAYHGRVEKVANQGQALDGYSALANYDDTVRQLKEEINSL